MLKKLKDWIHEELREQVKSLVKQEVEENSNTSGQPRHEGDNTPFPGMLAGQTITIEGPIQLEDSSDQDVRKELIQHLSREIDTQNKNMMLYRTKVNLTVYVGPLVVLGAILIKSDFKFILDNLTADGKFSLIGSFIALCVCFLGQALFSATFERHSWNKCEQWRKQIVELARGECIDENMSILFPSTMFHPYFAVYLILLLEVFVLFRILQVVGFFG